MSTNIYVLTTNEQKEISPVRYDRFVGQLFKPDTHNNVLMHAALGVCGEAGELADAIKKHVVYGKPLDFNNVREELGDLFFYMQALMNELGIECQEVYQQNANKLADRYKSLTYSDAAAIAREDKKRNNNPEKEG